MCLPRFFKELKQLPCLPCRLQLGNQNDHDFSLSSYTLLRILDMAFNHVEIRLLRVRSRSDVLYIDRLVARDGSSHHIKSGAM